MADRHRQIALRYLARNGRQYLEEIPESFLIVWTESDFWPSTLTRWAHQDTQDAGRLDLRAHRKGSPRFGQSTYFPDLVRQVDRLVWCLIGLPMALLAALFLPRHQRRWGVLYLTILPYLAIPFIAFSFSRYRVPAAPMVFLLAGQAWIACWDRRTRFRPEGPNP